jgi:hypothetical protein
MRRKNSQFLYYSSAIPGFAQIVQTIHAAWLEAKYKLLSEVVCNPPSRRNFRRHKPVLTSIQRHLVEQLQTQGVAAVDATELFGNSNALRELIKIGEDFATAANKFQEDVPNPVCRVGNSEVSLSHNQMRFERARTTKARGDDYLLKLYPEGPMVDISNPLLQFALSPEILNSVNCYLGLWSKLIYFDMWRTLTETADRRIGSQNWHRDRDDRNTVKVYLYLSQVDSTTGPLQYVPGSTVGGKYQHLWPWRASDPFPYPKRGDLEELVPASEWITCMGGPGTIIFCDTSGLHRGGVSSTHPRLTATWTFVTPASLFVRRFQIANNQRKTQLSPEARHALN